MKNLETLLTMSNITSANIIFFTIFFKTGRFNLPVILFVYFFLLSRWKRITKVILENRNPIITVNTEIVKSPSEYIADKYATTELTIKPTTPEIRDSYSEILYYDTLRKTISGMTCLLPFFNHFFHKQSLAQL